MRRSSSLLPLLISALAGLSIAPVAAAERPAVDLVAIILGGTADGATISVGKKLTAKVSQSGPGAFSASLPDGGKVAILVTEPTKCQFDIVTKGPNTGEFSLRFDTTKLRAVTFSPRGTEGGLNTFKRFLKGYEHILQVQKDGAFDDYLGQAAFRTSLSTDELDAAVAELQRTDCPAAR